ncbi:MAG TPA: transcription termination/antitermination NusG family protein [Candidatus Acidoferrales bacterium]|nr:transcription termination/antitermination NusG family protein [Candidatus Acidoferrales bacterium]
MTDTRATLIEMSCNSGTQQVRDDAFWYAAYTSANHEKRVAEQLVGRGVEHFLPLYEAKPMWQHPALGLADPGLRNTKSLSKEILSLPMSAETTEQQVDIVVDSIRNHYAPARACSRNHLISFQGN